MSRKNYKNLGTFFTLLRAGLWENSQKISDVFLGFREPDDWAEVYRLASEQSVLGLVLAGVDCLPNDQRPPKVELLQWIGEIQMLEQQNKKMNFFIGMLVDKMRSAGIYTLLIKGQGIAQCYERPYWRSCGDVDFLLSESSYKEAKEFLLPLASSVQEEDTQELHLGLNIEQWVVELHGTLRSCTFPKMDKIIDDVQRDVFYGGRVRSWMNGETQVFLPSTDCDVVFVFTHIIKHFFNGGIGLRQICDWCRLLDKYQDTINKPLLEKRLLSAGIISEWKTFAYLAVNTLGMPQESMPFYSQEKKWKRNAEKVLSVVIKTGNFGNNIDKSYLSKQSGIRRKITTVWHATVEVFFNISIFPMDSIIAWYSMMKKGILFQIRGIR